MKNVIVLVDDNQKLLDVSVKLLEYDGFKVHSFTNVASAKTFLATARIPTIYAIVSDLMMGPTDGLDFLSFIRSQPELADIDFFLITGTETSVFEQLYKPLNVKAVIKKPFTGKMLLAELRNKDFKTAARAG